MFYVGVNGIAQRSINRSFAYALESARRWNFVRYTPCLPSFFRHRTASTVGGPPRTVRRSLLVGHVHCMILPSACQIRAALSLCSL